MKLIKSHTVNRTDLKHLIFWALIGFINSNGGTGESKMPKIFSKYMKEIKMNRGEMPPLGIEPMSCKINSEMRDRVIKELKTVFPKSKFY